MPTELRSPITESAPDVRPAERLPEPAPTAPLVVAVLALVAVAAILADAPVWLRAPLVLAAALTAPGMPIVRFLTLGDPVARRALIVVTSVAVDTVLALAMVWTHVWYPDVVAAVLFIVTAALTVAERILLVRRTNAPTHSSAREAAGPAETAVPARVPHTDRSARTRTGILVAALIVAAALWVVALLTTDSSRLDQWGLLTAFPFTWYLAVAITVAACLVAILDRRISGVVRAASLGLVVLVVCASADVLEAAPRPPWVFKHIAVTAYIDQHGGVDASIDIYNRWPGFFAVSAFLGHAAGHLSALDYARWADLGFGLIDAALVLAIARTLTARGRWAWISALAFTITNWVGQNYYSPQAFAFMLYLGMALVALHVLRGTPIRLVQRASDRLAGRLAARAARRSASTAPPRPPAIVVARQPTSRGRLIAAVIVVLLLQATISASHQLTPFIAVVALAPLFLSGILRPRWMAFPLLLIPILFLLPNIGYVQSHFGLFSGFDPVANLTTAPTTQVASSLASTLQGRGVLLLTAITGVLALAGFLRNLRQGHIRVTVTALWLAVAPASTLLGQTYGGEARFRVVLFALPFLCIGVAWLFRPAPRRRVVASEDAAARRPRPAGVRASRRATAALVTALTVLLGLFVSTSYQPEATNRTPTAAVDAGLWLDHRFAANDTLFTVGNIPNIIGPNYDRFLKRYGQYSSLADQTVWFPGGLTPNDVTGLIQQYNAGGTTWLAFSSADPGVRGAYGTLTTAQVTAIERSIASVAEERYDRDGVRIYALSPKALAEGSDG